MKAFWMFLVFIVGFSFVIYGQNHNDSPQTQIILVDKLQDLNKMTIDFCDTLSVEFKGLYPSIDTLPSLTSDSTFVKTLLIKNGFLLVDRGSGNWEKGPRFVYSKYRKGDCNCSIYKKYYFDKKQKDGSYNLRVSERLVCNSDKFMDD
jgi:hypothetical protein